MHLRVTITWHAGDRAQLRSLFELADDSPQQLDAYIDQGRVLVAVDDEAVVGHLQLIEDELRSMAVAEDRQGEGIGRALVARAVEEVKGGADALILLPPRAPAHRRALVRAGFAPTNKKLRFIGKRLHEDARLDEDASAWHFTLGDFDFF